MIKELGFSQYAFGGRQEHVNLMAKELMIAKAVGIKISAVWLYITNKDSLLKLKSANEKVFDSLRSTELLTQIWVGIDAEVFNGLAHVESLTKASEMVAALAKRAKNLGCKIALYNHGGWFGEPENQLEIITKLPQYDIGIVYNFHHGHTQLENYSKIIDDIIPYLWSVNLNGMKQNGPKIVPIGEGDLEKDMIDYLLRKNYQGPFGILGHIKNEDVQVTLARNLNGLQSLMLKSPKTSVNSDKQR